MLHWTYLYILFLLCSMFRYNLVFFIFVVTMITSAKYFTETCLKLTFFDIKTLFQLDETNITFRSDDYNV